MAEEDDQDWFTVPVEVGETTEPTVDGDASSGQIQARLNPPESGVAAGEVQSGTVTFGQTAATDGMALIRLQPTV